MPRSLHSVPHEARHSGRDDKVGVSIDGAGPGSFGCTRGMRDGSASGGWGWRDCGTIPPLRLANGASLRSLRLGSGQAG